MTHDNMVAPGLLKHVGDEFGSDGCSTLVLLVLASVGKEGQDGCDPLRARDFAGVDHDAKLHERGVDLPAAGVDDVHVVFSHRLDDSDMALADPAFRHLGAAEWDSEPVRRQIM